MTLSLRTALFIPAVAVLGSLAVLGCEQEPIPPSGNDAGTTMDSGTNPADSGTVMNMDAGQMGVTCPTPLNQGCGAAGVAYEDRTAPAASRTVTFTTVTQPENGGNYNPRCITVKVGQTVTFQGSATNFSSHIMSQTCGPVMNLIEAGVTVTGSKTVTFNVAGDYGYQCNNHHANQTKMSGAIRVVP